MNNKISDIPYNTKYVWTGLKIQYIISINHNNSFFNALNDKTIIYSYVLATSQM